MSAKLVGSKDGISSGTYIAPSHLSWSTWQIASGLVHRSVPLSAAICPTCKRPRQQLVGTSTGRIEKKDRESDVSHTLGAHSW